VQRREEEDNLIGHWEEDEAWERRRASAEQPWGKYNTLFINIILIVFLSFILSYHNKLKKQET